MSHYKPYPAYKESGVEWIGWVPEHWETKRLRFVATLNPTPDWKALEEQQAEYPFLPMEAIGETGELDGSRRKVLHECRSGYTYFADGDVAYAKVTPCFENGKGALIRNLEGGHGFGTTELTVLRPTAATSDFLYALTFAQSFRQPGAAEMLGSGGLKRVPDDFARDYRAALPPVSEQIAIATALDRETARIDALIAKKTRFIELLTEKRQALITCAVTKGLDPSVKMKDSGVEWIGEVPEHWSVSQVKFVARVGNGSTPSRDRPDYWEGGSFPWLTSSCVNLEAVEKSQEFVTPTALNECHLPVIRPPAVLVGITGQGRTRGMATTLHIDATINQHIAYLKPNSSLVSTQFLRRFIDVAYDWLRLDSEGAGSTKGAITCEQLGALPMLLPPVEEQRRIIAHVSGRSTRIDSLASKTQHSIALLKERRAALITAAVTGQIDLRSSTESTL